MKISIRALKLLFAVVHFSFFLHLANQSGQYWFYAGCLLLPFYFFLPFDKTQLAAKKTVINVVLFSISFYCTQLGQLFFNPVESVVLMMGLYLLIAQYIVRPLSEYEALIYAAAFAGMIDPDWVNPYPLSFISCVLGALFFSVLKNSLNGIGGKLGSIGFASLITWILLQW